MAWSVKRFLLREDGEVFIFLVVYLCEFVNFLSSCLGGERSVCFYFYFFRYKNKIFFL